MPEERRVSISPSSHLAPDEVARHSFGSVRRGYDTSEVRAYLESIAVGLRGLAEREAQLLQELADAEYRAAHPVLDEPTLSAAVGSETARVLHSAHEASAEMVANAEAESARMLNEAHHEIEQTRTQTEGRLAQLTAESEAAASELRERATQQANAHLEAARAEADEVLARAREECRAMLEEAQVLRTRVLADLSKRRKVLHAQIEQLRAGRERLAETVKDVRRSVDVIAEDLFAAEDNARLAAEAAGREALERVDDTGPEEVAALLLAESDSGPLPAEPGPPAAEAAEAATDATAVDAVTEAVPAVEPDAEITEEVEIPAAAAPAGAGEAVPGATGETSDVEALFARIRASREEGDVDEGAGGAIATPESGAGAEGSTSGGTNPEEPAAAASPTAGPDGRTHQEPATTEGEVGTGAASGEPGPAASAPAEDDGPPDDRNPLVVRRDELIAPVVKSLARRLKRTLQDDQNELLDGLRSKGSRWSVDLLPDLTEQTDAYATASLPILEEAAEAGVTFAGTKRASKLSVDELAGIGHELAEAVVGPLRRRLSEDEGLGDADEAVVAEHVGSAFREWKGERIERLAGDYVVAAFSAGTIAATKGKKAVALEWVADSASADAPCPDCEDNGLNGSLRPDEAFPTGHRHPPAHPGCRCLLAVAGT